MTEYIDLEVFKADLDAVTGTEVAVRKAVWTEVSKAKIDRDELTVPFVISTARPDRDGDTIDVDGWKLQQYRRNPVVLWAHDSRQPPVARAEDVRVDGEEGRRRLLATARFTPREVNPFGHMIFQMYANGFLKATSVGFQPLEWERREDGSGRFEGIAFTRQELLEFSAVTVPANPDALVAASLGAKAKGVDVAPMREWLEVALDEWEQRKDGLVLPRDVVEKARKELVEAGVRPEDDRVKSGYRVAPDEQDDLLRRNLEVTRRGDASFVLRHPGVPTDMLPVSADEPDEGASGAKDEVLDDEDVTLTTPEEPGVILELGLDDGGDPDPDPDEDEQESALAILDQFAELGDRLTADVTDAVREYVDRSWEEGGAARGALDARVGALAKLLVRSNSDLDVEVGKGVERIETAVRERMLEATDAVELAVKNALAGSILTLAKCVRDTIDAAQAAQDARLEARWVRTTEALGREVSAVASSTRDRLDGVEERTRSIVAEETGRLRAGVNDALAGIEVKIAEMLESFAVAFEAQKALLVRVASKQEAHFDRAAAGDGLRSVRDAQDAAADSIGQLMDAVQQVTDDVRALGKRLDGVDNTLLEITMRDENSEDGPEDGPTEENVRRAVRAAVGTGVGDAVDAGVRGITGRLD